MRPGVPPGRPRCAGALRYRPTCSCQRGTGESLAPTGEYWGTVRGLSVNALHAHERAAVLAKRLRYGVASIPRLIRKLHIGVAQATAKSMAARAPPDLRRGLHEREGGRPIDDLGRDQPPRRAERGQGSKQTGTKDVRYVRCVFALSCSRRRSPESCEESKRTTTLGPPWIERVPAPSTVTVTSPGP